MLRRMEFKILELIKQEYPPFVELSRQKGGMRYFFFYTKQQGGGKDVKTHDLLRI